MPGLLSNECRRTVQDTVAQQPGGCARLTGLIHSMKRTVQ